ncbi:exopolysaccharide biosynthesis protein [Blastochloris viridis]|uniref:Exopolysaccharide synthesis protein ExoD-related protein n=1 Tax=Blastochloris viridis TaxID=1079 RepID=A0A0H5BIP7_BLAVI|nr:exopolysaccharide biosynthesis protein [Blastochloris viridis]ALK09091.1 Exopolysaccharide synthesis, ExoD [Blastochloris viridis]BAS01045.1 exopolysaccharide synthesis protein ExoD-related protein [Blastochloris viridis]CUU41754.1 Exopolysaccharide synthesis, ExoD [Blastochloris viridis]
MSAAGRRTSELLSELAVGDPDETITFGEVFHRLEHKAFGALFLVLAIPNCFPMVPGVSVITGVAVLLLALQLASGLEEPWLPSAIRHKGFARGAFARVLGKTLPWIVRVEQLASPRLQILTSGTGRRVFGAMIAVLAVAMMLPVPFIGNIPPGIAIAVLSLGLLEHDGRVVAVGYAVGTVAIIVVAGMLAGLMIGFEAIVF